MENENINESSPDFPFSLIEGSCVVLKKKGIYTPTKAYHMNGCVYAKYSAGFVTLWEGMATSCENIRVHSCEFGFLPRVGPTGRLLMPEIVREG